MMRADMSASGAYSTSEPERMIRATGITDIRAMPLGGSLQTLLVAG